MKIAVKFQTSTNFEIIMIVEPEYIYSGCNKFIWSMNLENPTFPKYTQPQTSLPHVHHSPHEFGEFFSN